ncbi:hypothetical protein E4P40_23490 [Blastococcus sp. CT_GayMR20]|uniref:GerMN domain-containing protein n=1 Tax=Blastococcus sp. CT_GayMR20 TaxID=2559609 RepID=UPI0010738248|nr:GerMN domain-containing protein [Blastococcus sp. CT_GayMR20]TFV68382.1 hypothetical protein E4P40_23490 [Blastococcus sp. CT_GayMR20]
MATGVALVLVLGGCGVPTGGPPAVVEQSDVPYGLAAPTPSSSAPPTPEVAPAPYRIFLVDGADVLVARPRELDGATPREHLAELLAALADAPTAGERTEEMSTSLPPGVRLSVTDLSGGMATIELGLPAEAPTGGAGRRAVAQIVLSASTVPGVDAVRLTVDGEPVEAPLPSGELISAPLTAEDYATFLTPPPPSTVPATPS